MERLLAWLRGEEPIQPATGRHAEVTQQLEVSRQAQAEAAAALEEWQRALRAMRRRPFPVSDAMQWRPRRGR